MLLFTIFILTIKTSYFKLFWSIYYSEFKWYH